MSWLQSVGCYKFIARLDEVSCCKLVRCYTLVIIG